MSHFLKICAASALLAASSFAVQAADAPASTPPDAPAFNDAQVVVRDADSGEFRAPTASEFRTLHAQDAKTLRAMRPLAMRTHATGAVGVRLTDEFMSYSVVIKQPDGRLVEYCFEDAQAAKAGVQSPAIPLNTLPTE
jgi:hypothetical protein